MNMSKVYLWPIFNQRFGQCVLCQEPAPLQTGFCGACRPALPAIGAAVCRCGLPSPTPLPGSGLCGRCLTRPPPFQQVHCPWAYDFPLDRLINRYKHHRQLAIERALLPPWLASLPAPGAVGALVPVPSHWLRQWQRGFNPAQRLARAAADHLGLPLLPALARPRRTRHQQGQRARARRRNLHGAFTLRQPATGLHLALVDDVVTTGSTVREASQCLLDAGAASVQVWALARTLPTRGR